jgi:hypothetical protein
LLILAAAEFARSLADFATFVTLFSMIILLSNRK